MTRVKMWALAVVLTSVAYGAAPATVTVSLIGTVLLVFELLMLEHSVQRYARERVASDRAD